jgi:hypothetical protein
MEEITREPILSLDEALTYISENFHKSFETLWISDEINDATGINMAIIGDAILKAGYMPAGFTQKDKYRTYNYSKKR